jgi:hypothetical protein
MNIDYEEFIMKKNNVVNTGKLVIAGSLFILGATSVHAQRVPLPIEREAPVLDQFSQALSRYAGDLVQVLAVGPGIQPPNPFSGEPHFDNRVLYETRVGYGINPGVTDPGFAAYITPRPDEPFFVRVYNAPTAAEATFYEDSDVYTPDPAVDATFYPQMTATTNPVNGALSPDGLTVSLKESLGLNPYAADSDGDSVADAEEIRMGTDALDAGSHMPPLVIYKDQGGVVNAYWDVSGADHAVMALAGLSEIEQTEMAQVYSDVLYQLQQSAELGELAVWSDIPGSASRVFEKWPPEVGLPEATDGIQYIRMKMTAP